MSNLRTVKALDEKAAVRSSDGNRDATVLAAAMTRALAANGPEAATLRSALSTPAGTDSTRVIASSVSTETASTPATQEATEASEENSDSGDAATASNEATEASEPASSETSGATGIDPTALTQALFAEMVKPLQSQLASLQEELTATKTSSAEELAAEKQKTEALKADLETAKVSAQVLSDVSKLMGTENGLKDGTAAVSTEDTKNTGSAAGSYGQGINFNTETSTSGDKLVGILPETMSMLSSCEDGFFRSTSSDRSRPVLNTRRFDQYVKANKSQIMTDLESVLSANGFLRGSASGTRNVSAATTAADVLGGFFPILSSIMRSNNRTGKIFHQFVRTVVDFNEGEGGTIRVPRAAYQPLPTDPNDRSLSGRGTYAGIENTNQSIKTGLVPIEVEEWGLGKDVNSAPIAIPMFVAAYSMIDLIGILDRNLWQDYITWEDLKARSLWVPTSAVVYNNGNNIVDDPANVVAGGDGRNTYEALQALGDLMYEDQVPTFADGCYGIAIPTRQLTTLRKSMDKNLEANRPEDIEAMTSYLEISTGGTVDKITGYKGKVGNMHVFSSNGWGVGGPANEGVQSETLGSGDTVNTTSAYAFGADTVGRGIGSPFNIRFDEKTDFNRIMRAIWLEESGWAPFDVDPTGYSDTSDVPQQKRVYEFRATSEEI